MHLYSPNKLSSDPSVPPPIRPLPPALPQLLCMSHITRRVASVLCQVTLCSACFLPVMSHHDEDRILHRSLPPFSTLCSSDCAEFTVLLNCHGNDHPKVIKTHTHQIIKQSLAPYPMCEFLQMEIQNHVLNFTWDSETTLRVAPGRPVIAWL